MKINVRFYWAESPYYNSGERKEEIEWGNTCLPQVNDQIDSDGLLESFCEKTEQFTIKGATYNIFSWINKNYTWRVQHIRWKHINGKAIPTLVIVDEGTHEYQQG